MRDCGEKVKFVLDESHHFSYRIILSNKFSHFFITQSIRSFKMKPNFSGIRDQQKPKLLDQVRSAIRARHCSIRTEEAYVQWIRRFILFHNKRHPREMGTPEINAFLSHLAVVNRVAASSRNQALSAILFLYKEVLGQEVGKLEGVVRAKKSLKLPVVFTVEEVQAVLVRLQGSALLMAGLLYGSGLRLMECVRLRVKDVDFHYRQLVVRDGKGQKDRVTMLPERVIEPFDQHLARVKAIHEQDLRDGMGAVYLPFAPKNGRVRSQHLTYCCRSRCSRFRLEHFF